MYKVLKYNGAYMNNRSVYVCDAEDDIANLPTQSDRDTPIPFSSVVYVIETGNTYMINSSGEWVLQPAGSGGGYNIATDAEVSAMLTQVFG